MVAQVRGPERIIYSNSPGERRIALMTGMRAEEFYIDRLHSYRRGTICKGRIISCCPNGRAFFVDIGGGVRGFLPVKKGKERYVEGESILVEVSKEGRGYKEIKLTKDVSIAGVYLVYTDRGDPIVFSKRLSDSEVKQRIWKLISPLLGEKESVIVRASAEQADDESLIRELEELKDIRRNIEGEFKQRKDSCILRDSYDFLPEMLILYHKTLKEIVCDDAGEAQKIKFFLEKELKGKVPEVTVYRGKEDIFTEYGLDEEIRQALSPEVLLPSGVRIIIQPTEAFWAIDVDSGSSEGSFEQVNQEAAEEIIRQIRVRNLSGQIVVDFISNRRHKLSSRMISSLREGLAKDSLPAFFAGVSPLGHAEIIRERRTQSLLEIYCCSSDSNGFELSPETLALEGLRGAIHRIGSGKSKIELRVPPAVFALLEGRLLPFRKEVNEKLGGCLDIISDSTLKGMISFMD